MHAATAWSLRKCQRVLWLALAACALSCMVSCSRMSPSAKPSPAIPAGSLMRDEITFRFAIYYLRTPTNDPIAVLAALLTDKFPTVRKVTQLRSGTEDVCVTSELATNVQESYSPPNA